MFIVHPVADENAMPRPSDGTNFGTPDDKGTGSEKSVCHTRLRRVGGVGKDPSS
jgi:hypothetical protein